MNFIKTLVAAATIFAATTASAALVIDGGVGGQIGDFNDAGLDNDVIIDVFGDGTLLNGFFNAQLQVDTGSMLKFEYIGKEAGWENLFSTGVSGSEVTAFNTDTSVKGDAVFAYSDAGLIDFFFSANNGADGSVANGDNNGASDSNKVDFFLSYMGDGSVLVAFDDGYGTSALEHDNHDDLVIRITQVPEPATLVLFGLGLAGLGAARRRSA